MAIAKVETSESGVVLCPVTERPCKALSALILWKEFATNVNQQADEDLNNGYLGERGELSWLEEEELRQEVAETASAKRAVDELAQTPLDCTPLECEAGSRLLNLIQNGPR